MNEHAIILRWRMNFSLARTATTEWKQILKRRFLRNVYFTLTSVLYLA